MGKILQFPNKNVKPRVLEAAKKFDSINYGKVNMPVVPPHQYFVRRDTTDWLANFFRYEE